MKIIEEIINKINTKEFNVSLKGINAIEVQSFFEELKIEIYKINYELNNNEAVINSLKNELEKTINENLLLKNELENYKK